MPAYLSSPTVSLLSELDTDKRLSICFHFGSNVLQGGCAVSVLIQVFGRLYYLNSLKYPNPISLCVFCDGSATLRRLTFKISFTTADNWSKVAYAPFGPGYRKYITSSVVTHAKYRVINLLRVLDRGQYEYLGVINGINFE
jgi:hypothetical protein